MLIVIGLSVFFLYCLAVGTRHAASVYYWYVFALTHFLFSRRLRKERRVFCIRAGAGGVASFATTEGAEVGEGSFSPYPLSNRANLLLMVCPGLVATICPFMGLPTRAMSPMMSSSLCLAGSLSHTRGLCCM